MTSSGPAQLPVVAVVGPTATGKSDLGLELALALGGEVVNADSMQIYRGMDIGTAKLPEVERRGVPHHLLDVLDVTQEARVAAYQTAARSAFDEIRARGRVPVLVGGSGLYVAAVLDRLDFPGTDPVVRSALEAELDDEGAPALHARLARLDPAAAAAIAPVNGRKIVRALEVIELTGAPFAAALPVGSAAEAMPSVRIGLLAPRPLLHDRIRLRVDRMWAAGRVDEVRRLERVGLREGRTAPRALGYAQVLRWLDGTGTEAEAVEATVVATRQFARRQDTWFRRDPAVRWLPFDAPDLLDQALRLVRPATSATGCTAPR
jgi:tRNA dimethylallyltransferase